VDGIVGDYHCEFRHNSLSTNQMFCTCEVLEKKWECNGTVHQIFIEFEKDGLFRREVLYNILIKFGVSMKIDRLIKMCSKETWSKVHIGKHLYDTFHI